jgi:hypothetical protein
MALGLTGLVVASSPPPVDRSLVVTLEGGRTAPLSRAVVTSDPARGFFPTLDPGGSGGLAFEFGFQGLQWLSANVGLRGRISRWQAAAGETATLWDVGIRGRIEFILGPVRPWLGISSAAGNLTLASAAAHRDVVLFPIGLSGGVRVRLPGPVLVGAFLESITVTSFARPQELFYGWCLGADVSLSFDLGPTRPAATPMTL